MDTGEGMGTDTLGGTWQDTLGGYVSDNACPRRAKINDHGSIEPESRVVLPQFAPKHNHACGVCVT
jgi:hypothetical protein